MKPNCELLGADQQGARSFARTQAFALFTLAAVLTAFAFFAIARFAWDIQHLPPPPFGDLPPLSNKAIARPRPFDPLSASVLAFGGALICVIIGVRRLSAARFRVADG